MIIWEIHYFVDEHIQSKSLFYAFTSLSFFLFGAHGRGKKSEKNQSPIGWPVVMCIYRQAFRLYNWNCIFWVILGKEKEIILQFGQRQRHTPLIVRWWCRCGDQQVRPRERERGTLTVFKYNSNSRTNYVKANNIYLYAHAYTHTANGIEAMEWKPVFYTFFG